MTGDGFGLKIRCVSFNKKVTLRVTVACELLHALIYFAPVFRQVVAGLVNIGALSALRLVRSACLEKLANPRAGGGI